MKKHIKGGILVGFLLASSGRSPSCAKNEPESSEEVDASVRIARDRLRFMGIRTFRGFGIFLFHSAIFRFPIVLISVVFQSLRMCQRDCRLNFSLSRQCIRRSQSADARYRRYSMRFQETLSTYRQK